MGILVKEAKQALDVLKYEIAAELGLAIGGAGSGAVGNVEFGSELGSVGSYGPAHEAYWGYLSTRDAGAVGGHITRMLVRKAEEASFQP